MLVCSTKAIGWLWNLGISQCMLMVSLLISQKQGSISVNFHTPNSAMTCVIKGLHIKKLPCRTIKPTLSDNWNHIVPVYDEDAVGSDFVPPTRWFQFSNIIRPFQHVEPLLRQILHFRLPQGGPNYLYIYIYIYIWSKLSSLWNHLFIYLSYSLFHTDIGLVCTHRRFKIGWGP